MKPRLAFALPLLLAAAPAAASGGFDCRATDRSGVGISGTTGRVAGSPLVGAALRVAGRSWATTDPVPRIVVARSWIDRHRIWVDLADPQVQRFEARLRVRLGRRGTGTGTLVQGGVPHPVSCTVE